MTSPEIVVIGAGFAGLSAAVRLSNAGRRVLVLEARPRLGGRATAFEDRVTGALVDNGQHVMFGCYHETLALLRTIGAESNVRVQASLHVPFVDARQRVTHLRCPDLPSPLHLFGGLIEWDALRWRDRFAAARVWRAVRSGGRGHEAPGTRHEAPGTRHEAPGTSVDEWLRELRQTRRLRTFLWEPLAVAALNETPEEASAEAFAQILALMFSGPPSNAAIVMPAVPLDRMYAEPARAFIESHGGEVRTNALARIVTSSGAVKGVRVGADTIPCDRVICSVPWNTFANVFETMPRSLEAVATAAAAMVSRPIVTANLWFDRAVMDEPFIGFPGATIQWAFEKNVDPAHDGSHLSCTVSGASTLVDRTNEEILRIAEDDIRDRLPGAARAALIRGTIVRERHATFSTAQPGITRPPAQTPVSGLYLAGDWIESGLPSTIEGAVISGRLAADATLAGPRTWDPGPRTSDLRPGT